MARAKTSYLAEHLKATVEVALKYIKEKAHLDGCYILKTNVPKKVAGKVTLHKRYIDLAMVEHAFRTIKQSFEELQTMYVRKETRTRRYAFVCICMLSYRIIKYIWDEGKESGSTTVGYFLITLMRFIICNLLLKVIPLKNYRIPSMKHKLK